MAKEHSHTSILRELEPVVEDQLNEHLRIATDWNPHEYVPWERGRNFARLGGVDWDETQSELGRAATTAMVVNLLTEENLPSYHRVIADTFGRDGAWGTWVGRWTAEEGRHGTAIHDHLLVTRAVDPDALERERMTHVTTGYDSSRTPLEGVAYVTLQELATRISHRNTGRVAGEDGDVHAEKLLQRIAMDENLHMRFYRNIAKAAFEIDPNAMMQAVAGQVQNFEMPGATLADFRKRAMLIAKAGIYNARQHMDEVVRPTLQFWDVEDRGDLTGEGDRARTNLFEWMEQMEQLIKDGEARRAEREARRAARGETDLETSASN